jgi:transposase-like protein
VVVVVTEYNEHIKAQALAALLTGQSFSEVARAFNIPIGTLKSWKSRSVDVLDAPDATAATTKRDRIGTLILEYIEEGLTTLREQAKVFRDYDWLQKQSASEVAILHGVIADKQIRLLEALADEAE